MSATVKKQSRLNFRKRKSGVEKLVDNKKPRVKGIVKRDIKTVFEEEEENFIPESIHRMVKYTTEGRNEQQLILSKTIIFATQKISKECIIPFKFSFGSPTHGPLSGLS